MAKAKKTMRHASALKAHRQSLAHRTKNVQIRSKVRTLTAKVLKELEGKNLDTAKAAFRTAQAAWQKAAKQGVFTKNAASRKISRLANRIAAVAKG